MLTDEQRRKKWNKYIREYNKRPEVKEKRNKYIREYNKRPYVKIRIKNYNKRLYVKKKINKYMGEYRQRIEVREKINKYIKNKRTNNKSYRIKERVRSILNLSFKLYSMTGKIIISKKYGVNFTKIIEHLKPFPEDIKNYHVDHIIPLSRFNFDNPKHIKIAFAPENHQWLTIEENLKKGNRLVIPH